MPKETRRPDYFTATVAKMWCRLFMACYRLGVHDAAECDDEGLCREYMEYTSEPCRWAFMDKRKSDNAIDIQLWLTSMGRDCRIYKPLMEYFRRMGRYGGNFMSVALTVCQGFYNRGMSDYLEFPDRGLLPRFDCKNNKSAYLWGCRGLRKCDTDMIVDIAQEIVGERQDIDCGSESRKAMRPVQYDMFRLCISKARRRYSHV